MRSLLFLAALAAAAPVFGDVASHRQAAADVLDLINGPAALQAGVKNPLNALLDNLRREGAPEDALREIRVAVEEWAKTEIVWDEIKPQMIELYTNQFTEPELRQLLAFYRSPIGAKALERFPGILADAAKLGEAYALSKQGSLNARLERIADKYSTAKPSNSTKS